jgi:hypothetical protein
MKLIKRRKKVFIKRLPGGYLVVMRLLPWMRTQYGCVWLASLAVGKSRRQINDWLKRKTRKQRVRRLDTYLTGRYANRIQAIGIQQVRQWIQELPPGDSITLRCESAKPDKQFRVWKKWFQRWEDARWDINEEFKSFFYYKPRLVK